MLNLQPPQLSADESPGRGSPARAAKGGDCRSLHVRSPDEPGCLMGQGGRTRSLDGRTRRRTREPTRGVTSSDGAGSRPRDAQAQAWRATRAAPGAGRGARGPLSPAKDVSLTNGAVRAPHVATPRAEWYPLHVTAVRLKATGRSLGRHRCLHGLEAPKGKRVTFTWRLDQGTKAMEETTRQPSPNA